MLIIYRGITCWHNHHMYSKRWSWSMACMWTSTQTENAKKHKFHHVVIKWFSLYSSCFVVVSSTTVRTKLRKTKYPSAVWSQNNETVVLQICITVCNLVCVCVWESPCDVFETWTQWRLWSKCYGNVSIHSAIHEQFKKTKQRYNTQWLISFNVVRVNNNLLLFLFQYDLFKYSTN